MGQGQASMAAAEDDGDSCLAAGLVNGRNGANSVRALRDRLQKLHLLLQTRAAEAQGGAPGLKGDLCDSLQTLSAEPSSAAKAPEDDAPGPNKDDLCDGLQHLELQPGADEQPLADTEGDAPVLKDGLIEVLEAWFLPTSLAKKTEGDAPPRGLKEELLVSLMDVYFGLDLANRSFQIFFKMALEQGARPEFAAFCLMSNDKLYDLLLRLRLPTPPTTKDHAIARFEVAMYCVCLLAEHLFKRCVDDIQKIDLAKPPQDSGVDQALASLDRARTVADLAATHADLAIPILADLVDPDGWSLEMCHPRPRRTDADASNSSN